MDVIRYLSKRGNRLVKMQPFASNCITQSQSWFWLCENVFSSIIGSLIDPVIYVYQCGCWLQWAGDWFEQINYIEKSICRTKCTHLSGRWLYQQCVCMQVVISAMCVCRCLYQQCVYAGGYISHVCVCRWLYQQCVYAGGYISNVCVQVVISAMGVCAGGYISNVCVYAGGYISNVCVCAMRFDYNCILL